MKGGTALNFFVRDLPRISVDIDLAYLPINERDEALMVSATLARVAKRLEQHYPDIKVTPKHLKRSDMIVGFVASSHNVSIKVEPNLVMLS